MCGEKESHSDQCWDPAAPKSSLSRSIIGCFDIYGILRSQLPVEGEDLIQCLGRISHIRQHASHIVDIPAAVPIVFSCIPQFLPPLLKKVILLVVMDAQVIDIRVVGGTVEQDRVVGQDHPPPIVLYLLVVPHILKQIPKGTAHFLQIVIPRMSTFVPGQFLLETPSNQVPFPNRNSPRRIYTQSALATTRFQLSISTSCISSRSLKGRWSKRRIFACPKCVSAI